MAYVLIWRDRFNLTLFKFVFCMPEYHFFKLEGNCQTCWLGRERLVALS